MILQGKTMILESGSQKTEALIYDTLRNIFSNPVSRATSTLNLINSNLKNINHFEPKRQICHSVSYQLLKSLETLPSN